ncbi:MAG: hypothetical protein ACLP59_34850 [Bryobacteraceae bacterium]
MKIAVILGWLFLRLPLWSADDGCSLLTQVRISEVLGVQVAPGTHSGETPSGRLLCTWNPPAAAPLGDTKRVMIHLYAPIGRLTPADRFANLKKPALEGITSKPVAGIGDDALFLKSGGMLKRLCVKKGESVFEISVGGFSEAETETLEKTLARDAASKL